MRFLTTVISNIKTVIYHEQHHEHERCLEANSVIWHHIYFLVFPN